jgi:hypothetical protein
VKRPRVVRRVRCGSPWYRPEAEMKSPGLSSHRNTLVMFTSAPYHKSRRIRAMANVRIRYCQV